jgi:hypothetical protein
MMDPLETCKYNLSGCRAHYETLNLEISVLKNSNVHLLGAISLIWHRIFALPQKCCLIDHIKYKFYGGSLENVHI